MICSKVGRDPSRGLSVDDLIRVYCYFDLGEIDRDFAALGLGPPASEVIQQAVEAARAANRSASDARRLIYTFSASEQAEHTACVRATTADGESGEAAVPLRFPPIASSSSLRVPFVPEVKHCACSGGRSKCLFCSVLLAVSGRRRCIRGAHRRRDSNSDAPRCCAAH